ncbi:MAG: hypothetical protein M1825_000352 [Sarcosagium campestre]|nr:MAG: hypothetical protein M1825_000352 [Sarcosagium campestre]
MPSTDLDHNYYSQQLGQPTPPSPPTHVTLLPHRQSNDPNRSAEAILRPVVYTSSHPPNDAQRRRPSVSTGVSAIAALDSSSQGVNAGGQSPDPHEFYRPFQDYPSPKYHVPAADLDRGEAMTTTSRRPSAGRANGIVPKPPAMQRSEVRPPHRSASAQSNGVSALTAAKSTPTLSSSSRSQQSSLKDLVNRFNQNSVESLPLPPSNPAHWLGDRKSSADGSTQRTPRRSDASRISSDTLDTRLKSRVDRTPEKQSKSRNRAGSSSTTDSRSKAGPDAGSPAKSRSRTTRAERVSTAIENNPWASHSMTNLHLSQNESARRPLFGEVLGLGDSWHDAGYGIPGRRRRGSDSGVHPSLTPRNGDAWTFDEEPPSPTAFYLGDGPSMHGQAPAEQRPSSARRPHRRAKSDFADISKSSHSRRPVAVDRPAVDLSNGNAPAAKARPRLGSGASRIPLSTDRRGFPSDRGDISPRSRPDSALGSQSTLRNFTPKSPSGIPKPNRRSISPIQVHPLTPSRGGARRHDASPGLAGGSSPHLKAYISAPLPKKSPPLRSSRPRLPVSSASPSGTRGKVAERYLPHNQSRASPEDRQLTPDAKPRPKKLPELGNVDFAARRDKIQRQFTKRVRERERKEEFEAEKRRATQARTDSQLSRTDSNQSKIADELQKDPGDDAHNPTSVIDEHQIDRTSEEIRPSPATQDHAQGADKNRSGIETPNRRATIFQEDVTDTESTGQPLDSPTLGLPGAFPDSLTVSPEQHSLSPTSVNDATAPLTPIDNEPQDDSPVLSGTTTPKMRDLFGQELHKQQDSLAQPAAQNPAPPADPGSDMDDKESIQIILGATPVNYQAASDTLPWETTTEETRPEVTTSSQLQWSAASSVSSSQSRYRQPAADSRNQTRNDEHFTHNTDDSLAVPPVNNPDSWTAASDEMKRNKHSTMSSETYGTINKVLAHYHEPDLNRPEAFYDLRRHLITNTPELARQGGWDPTRVTQLYLEEKRKQRANGGEMAPHPPDSRPEHVSAVSSEPSKISLHHQSGLNDTVTLPARGATPSQLKPFGQDSARSGDSARPRDDDGWIDASPSLMNWIATHTDEVSPGRGSPDYRPVPPPKDGTITRKVPVGQPPRTPSAPPASEPRQARDNGAAFTPEGRPVLPEIRSAGEGLGLAIQVEPAEESPTLPLPPLPMHAPPPPPPEAALDEMPAYGANFHADPQCPPSPSVYSRHPASTIFPMPTTFREGLIAGPESFRTSDASSQPQRISVTSLSQTQPSSKSHSQERVSEDTQATPSLHSTGRSTSPSLEDRRLLKRKRLIKELLDTEKSFHDDMKITDEIYKVSSSDAITPDDIKVLFGNSDQIVAFSESFYETLRNAGASVYLAPKILGPSQSRRTSGVTSNSAEETNRPSSEVTLSDEEQDRKTFFGEVFVQEIKKMEKVYGDYLRNHEQASKRLVKLQSQPKIAIWLKECALEVQDLTTAWSLDSLLVKPVQRFLKYPLLLAQLLEVTPENHPDFTALDFAAREITAASHRVNEMKRRVDIVEKVVRRKRNESDVRAGLSKAFRGRTEKLRQHVGLSESVDDAEYNKIAENWDPNYIQLQFAMRDIEGYLVDVQTYVDKFGEYIGAIEAFMDVSRSTHPELESKWRHFGMAMRDMSTIALVEHKNAVQKSVIDPMKTLIQLYDSPQKIMHKRNKRLVDYARFKAVKERGDKPDKRTQEQGEQFIALNDALKDELPRLYALTAKLAEACLAKFVELSAQWQSLWQLKLRSIFDESDVPKDAAEIVNQFSGDFALTEAQVVSLGICNGSVLADPANHLSPASVHETDDANAWPRRPRKLSGRDRSHSLQNENSPVIPVPDFGQRHSGSFSLSPILDVSQHSQHQHQYQHQQIPPHRQYTHAPVVPAPMDRVRMHSAGSSQMSVMDGYPPPTAHSLSGTSYGSPQSQVRPSMDTGFTRDSTFTRPTTYSSSSFVRPSSGSTYFSTTQDAYPPSPSTRPFSGMFSSAMPMSDSPRPSPHGSGPPSPREQQQQQQQQNPPGYNVIFLAASLFEFNIDRARKEAGYPYLTYVPGEVFDVIGEKGELWLAKNQDDASNQIGWIWCRGNEGTTGPKSNPRLRTRQNQPGKPQPPIVPQPPLPHAERIERMPRNLATRPTRPYLLTTAQAIFSSEAMWVVGRRDFVKIFIERPANAPDDDDDDDDECSQRRQRYVGRLLCHAEVKIEKFAPSKMRPVASPATVPSDVILNQIMLPLPSDYVCRCEMSRSRNDYDYDALDCHAELPLDVETAERWFQSQLEPAEIHLRWTGDIDGYDPLPVPPGRLKLVEKDSHARGTYAQMRGLKVLDG